MLEKILLILIAIFGIYLYNSIDNNARTQVFKATIDFPAKAQQIMNNPQLLLVQK